MVRWEPDAAGRLREAAMALYAEQGYERTTVAEIAERAGVTARTFFRHFADKREVLFDGGHQLERHMVDALTMAPRDASPMDAVAAGLLAAADLFVDRREQSRLRQTIIASTPELRERELIKMSRLAAAFTDALAARGVAPGVAALAAEAGLAVFRVAFERWVTAAADGTAADADVTAADDGTAPDLADVMRATLTDLAGLTAS